jgi:leader peptidase (prepilin peptidase)/N-methyltransferase
MPADPADFSWDQLPFAFWASVFFVLGCLVGSFLNVCIHRLPRDLSLIHPPSHCPHCQYAIPFWLNVPLLTWLMLRGRCRNCGAPISVRYFLVELLTGLLFLAAWWRFGESAPGAAALACLVLSGLLVATFIDLEHYIIPDQITYGGVVLGLVLSFIFPDWQGFSSEWDSLKASAIGAAVGAGIVYAVLRLGKLLFGRQTIKLPAEATLIFTETALHLPDQTIPYEEIFYRKTDTVRLHARRVELIDRSYWNVPVQISPETLRLGADEFTPESVVHLEVLTSEITLPREAMGLGDVKFMAAIGAFLGWQGALFSLLASSLLGTVGGVATMALRHRSSSRIPYGPYLALAAALWLFGRDWFLHWFIAR